MKPEPNRLILLSTLLILPAVALLSWWAWQGMEDNLRAEAGQARHFEDLATYHVVNDLGSELFDLRFSFNFALARAIEQGTADWLGTVGKIRAAYLAQAHYPALLGEVWVVSGSHEGKWLWTRWSPDGWDPTDPPGWAPSAATLFAEPLDPEVSLDNTTFTFLLPPQGLVHRAVLVHYSLNTVLSVIVPDLARRAFGGQNPAYQVAVSQQVVGVAAGDPGADLTVPLVPRVKFTDWLRSYLDRTQPVDLAADAARELWMSRASVGPGVRWTLAVKRLPRGLSVYEGEVRQRNFFGAGILFLVLAGGVFLLLTSVFRYLRATQRARTLAAMISHELKTPLAAVRSLSENLEAGLVADPDRVREYGTRILEQTGRLGEMVGQILVEARSGQPPAGGEFDLSDLVRDPLHGVRPPVVGPGPWTARGDRAAVEAALENLVANAVRYGHRGGADAEVSMALLRERRWGRWWVGVAVLDHGVVFDRWQIRELFRPRPVKPGPDHLPSGVGLALVRRSIRHLGGRVLARPVPGGGLAVVLWLRNGGDE